MKIRIVVNIDQLIWRNGIFGIGYYVCNLLYLVFEVELLEALEV